MTSLPFRNVRTDSPGPGRVSPLSRAPTAVASAVVSAVASARTSSDSTRDRSPHPGLRAAAVDDDDVRKIIVQAFAPRIAVYASDDAEELVRRKGIFGGLCGLLRPFGEKVQGSVVIRDSIGSSRSWNDYGIRFVPFRESTSPAKLPTERPQTVTDMAGRGRDDDAANDAVVSASRVEALDQVTDHFLGQTQDQMVAIQRQQTQRQRSPVAHASTPRFQYYLHRLLAGRAVVAHETFTHPVACVVAISSQNTSPIDTLRDLYNDTRQENANAPYWIASDFLRYYVLVHDEDHDDLASSTALFNQMKRHFGLHCHLLRLRSVECLPNDPDGTMLPACEWLSADEELFRVRLEEQNNGVVGLRPYLFDTDVATVRTFIREMVTQSIVPFLEGRVTAWNDQVASRRRGISGRFISLSKRWTGFGTGRGANIGGAKGTGVAPGSSYNPNDMAYAPDSAEGLMHRLADHAFMLRDWRFASSIYDTLKGDFSDDKAWYHYTSACEMLALSLLLTIPSNGSRAKIEVIDQLLDTAAYSYTTRCSDPRGTIRCLLLSAELYRSCGGAFTVESAKWAERLLELALLSSVEQRLEVERLAVCYATRNGDGASKWGTRSRKAGLWSFLAAQGWLSSDKPMLAEEALTLAALFYELPHRNDHLPAFAGMDTTWHETRDQAASKAKALGLHTRLRSDAAPLEDEAEKLDERTPPKARSHRLSMGPLSVQPDTVEFFQRINDPLDQGDDGFA